MPEKPVGAHSVVQMVSPQWCHTVHVYSTQRDRLPLPTKLYKKDTSSCLQCVVYNGNDCICSSIGTSDHGPEQGSGLQGCAALGEPQLLRHCRCKNTFGAASLQTGLWSSWLPAEALTVGRIEPWSGRQGRRRFGPFPRPGFNPADIEVHGHCDSGRGHWGQRQPHTSKKHLDIQPPILGLAQAGIAVCWGWAGLV